MSDFPEESQNFIDQILAEPEEQSHKLVYSDWLEERGYSHISFALRWMAKRNKFPFQTTNAKWLYYAKLTYSPPYGDHPSYFPSGCFLWLSEIPDRNLGPICNMWLDHVARDYPSCVIHQEILSQCPNPHRAESSLQNAINWLAGRLQIFREILE